MEDVNFEMYVDSTGVLVGDIGAVTGGGGGGVGVVGSPFDQILNKADDVEFKSIGIDNASGSGALNINRALTNGEDSVITHSLAGVEKYKVGQLSGSDDYVIKNSTTTKDVLTINNTTDAVTIKGDLQIGDYGYTRQAVIGDQSGETVISFPGTFGFSFMSPVDIEVINFKISSLQWLNTTVTTKEMAIYDTLAQTLVSPIVLMTKTNQLGNYYVKAVTPFTLSANVSYVVCAVVNVNDKYMSTASTHALNIANIFSRFALLGGDYVVFPLSASQPEQSYFSNFDYHPLDTKLTVDTTGVSINSSGNKFTLPTAKGNLLQVMTSNGTGGTLWVQPQTVSQFLGYDTTTLTNTTENELFDPTQGLGSMDWDDSVGSAKTYNIGGTLSHQAGAVLDIKLYYDANTMIQWPITFPSSISSGINYKITIMQLVKPSEYHTFICTMTLGETATPSMNYSHTQQLINQYGGHDHTMTGQWSSAGNSINIDFVSIVHDNLVIF
jgi:hypothetical protein